MSEQQTSPRAKNRPSPTLIGTGMRVDGRITFSGLMHVQGQLDADVSSPADGQGKLVVDASGCIRGTVNVPEISVTGRIEGPVQAEQFLEVGAKALIVGDVSYREIELKSGGRIDGQLIPLARLAAGPAGKARKRKPADSSEVAFSQELAADTGADPSASSGAGGQRKWVLALALGLGLSALVVWALRRPSSPDIAATATTAPAVVPAPALDPSAARPELKPAAPLESTVADRAAVVPPPVPLPAASKTTDAAVPAVTETRPAAAPAERPASGPRKVVLVQGLNPAKAAGFFFMTARQPAVLMKKLRDDPGEGRRIDVAARKSISVKLEKNELIRVAEGSGIEIFYQGRKVAQETIESGHWMNFVPIAPGEAVKE